MATETAQHRAATLSVPALTAMVVGSMVGAGVFQLPARFAGETGVYGALIAWTIAGLGMLTLAFVFQNLAVRQPHLDNGIYVYARTGFGVYPGFLSAIGFWASACAGNAFYLVLIMSTLSQLFPGLAPVLGEGDTWPAFLASAALVWGFYLLIRRGVKEAAAVNAVVTVAKILPLALFLVLLVFFFDGQVFRDNLAGGADLPGGESLFQQVQGTMLVTVFVFLGIEGASVYSRYAARRKDVGRATVLGFLSVLSLFASISILSYGILPKAEIAQLQQPSVGGVLEAAVGPWGGTFIRVGLIVAVLGAYLAWQLLAADVLFAAARDHDLPAHLARVNRREVPERGPVDLGVRHGDPLRGAVRQRGPGLHPGPHRGPGAHAARADQRLRGEGGVGPGWLPGRRAEGAHPGAGRRRPVHDLHPLPGVGRGLPLPVPRLHPAGTGHHPVCRGAA